MPAFWWKYVAIAAVALVCFAGGFALGVSREAGKCADRVQAAADAREKAVKKNIKDQTDAAVADAAERARQEERDRAEADNLIEAALKEVPDADPKCPPALPAGVVRALDGIRLHDGQTGAGQPGPMHPGN